MRTVLTALILAAAAPAVAAPAPLQAPTPRRCSESELQHAGVAPGQFKRLGELPPAQLNLAVIRIIGGCFVATVKVEGVVYYVPLNRVEDAQRARTPPHGAEREPQPPAQPQSR